MKRYPIIFGLRDLIQGDGFLAGVAVDGRALLHEEEDGSWWAEGVNPGGFVATGTSAAAALEEFRRSYTAILFDIAEDAGSSFREFKAQVSRFFHGSASEVEQEWNDAVNDVRQGRVSAEWLAHQPADSPRRVRVVPIDQPSAENNKVEAGTALAA